MSAGRDPAGLEGLADLLGVALDVGEEGIDGERKFGAEGVLPHISKVQLVENGLLWVGVVGVDIH